MVCMRIGFHENNGNHENDENDENDKDNSDSCKQGVECSVSRNHGSHESEENHENRGCKPRVRQATGLEIPERYIVDPKPHIGVNTGRGVTKKISRQRSMKTEAVNSFPRLIQQCAN